MMKKIRSGKKLELKREILRRLALTNEELAEIMGAAGTDTGNSKGGGVPCSFDVGCQTDTCTVCTGGC